MPGTQLDTYNDIPTEKVSQDNRRRRLKSIENGYVDLRRENKKSGKRSKRKENWCIE